MKHLFSHCVDAVEDNNRINNGSWSDWKDAKHILECYETEFQGETPDKVEQALTEFCLDAIIIAPEIRDAWVQYFNYIMYYEHLDIDQVHSDLI